jgi:putative ABC transport system ATP-binding protein
MTAASPVLDVRGVSKVYRRGATEVHALRNVSVRLGAGRMLAIMGPSGAGKTTLLNILAGLDRPTSGEVWIGDQRLDRLDGEQAAALRRRRIGFVFQFFNLLPALTAVENVELPMLPERLSRREIAARAEAALAAVGLTARAGHRPGEMSGGEQQRVAIARALVMRPEVVLADEPTGNLDSVTGTEIVALLRGVVRERHVAMVVVTHSEAVAAECDGVMRMTDGSLGTGSLIS